MIRFWSKVEKTSRCWEWRASRMKRGYGYFKMSNPRRTAMAHRVAWEITNGPIPDGLCVCHHCDNPGCVNPAHLFLGTQRDNNLDAASKLRHAHGELSPRARLKADDVSGIRLAAKSGVRGRALAARYGVSEAQVSRIVNRRKWKELPP